MSHKYQKSNHFVKLIMRLLDTLAIGGVDDENKTLGVLIVVAPQWSDFVLSADIPHSEWNIFVFDSFNIETWKLFAEDF